MSLPVITGIDRVKLDLYGDIETEGGIVLGTETGTVLQFEETTTDDVV